MREDPPAQRTSRIEQPTLFDGPESGLRQNELIAFRMNQRLVVFESSQRRRLPVRQWVAPALCTYGAKPARAERSALEELLLHPRGKCARLRGKREEFALSEDPNRDHRVGLDLT